MSERSHGGNRYPVTPRRPRRTLAAAAVLIAAVATSTGVAATDAHGGSPDVAAVARKADPALVDVNSAFGYQGAMGAGTGIVLTSQGEILTNNHVVSAATSISVTDVGNGRTYAADVVGYDASHDVAVLHLRGASGLATADIGGSSGVSEGQPVVALGNAGGVGGAPSSAAGSVTGLNRSITATDTLGGTSEQLAGLIEVNANIQSGDSGGSLVDRSGRVVGMDAAAAVSPPSQSAQSARGGDGFAIPIDTALSVARQVEAGHRSSTVHVGPTAFLGVLVQAPGTQGAGSAPPGAVIAQVVPGGAAARAGLTAGDVITSLDGRTIASGADLNTVVDGLKPGQSVPVGYLDASGQTQHATTTLGSGPAA